MALFTLYRGLLLAVFRADLGGGWGAADVVRCFQRGFSFDMSTATVMVLPSLVAGLALAALGREEGARRFRAVVIGLLAAVSTALALANLGFVREYKEQFNHWIFGLLYDDRAAILKTVWKDYPVLWALLGWVVLTFLTARVLIRFSGGCGRLFCPENRLAAVRRPIFRLAWGLLLVALVFVGARGSLKKRPIQQKDAAVTPNRMLNALVPNYYSALRFAIRDHLSVADPRRPPAWLPNGDIRAVATRLYGEQARVARSLDELLTQTVRPHAPPARQRPRHIVLVVLESGDLWPMLPAYTEMGLMPETRRLANSGLFFPRFLSTGWGTMPSLAAIITGLPDTDVPQNYQPLSRQPFPTSISAIFRRLGYRTRLFYGGFLSWQRLGDFAREQGFDEIHGGGEMARTAGDLGEWGVPDGQLFDSVAARTGEAPTFTLIMTTSYHPPFSLDLEALGCPQPAVPPALAPLCDGGGGTLRQFAHLRYADRELGRFVDGLERRFPGCLFAVTGDHWSRRFLNSHPPLYESRAVPLVLYGPRVLPSARELAGEGTAAPQTDLAGELPTPGSHMDIAPTLAGLAAEPGFRFASFGRDLLAPADGPLPAFAVGRGYVITAARLEPVEEETLPPDGQLREWRTRSRAWLGLAWWRLMRGPELPPAAKAAP